MEKYLKNNLNTGLKIGEKYTMIGVGSFMAMTFKKEIKIVDIEKVESYAQYSNIYRLVFKQKRKRKLNGILISRDMIFLKGWDTELKVDTEFNCFSGNALINFIGDRKKIRETIDKENIFPHTNLGRITSAEVPSEKKRMLYPNKADQEHAVVRRIMFE